MDTTGVLADAAEEISGVESGMDCLSGLLRLGVKFAALSVRLCSMVTRFSYSIYRLLCGRRVEYPLSGKRPSEHPPPLENRGVSPFQGRLSPAFFRSQQVLQRGRPDGRFIHLHVADTSDARFDEIDE